MKSIFRKLVKVLVFLFILISGAYSAQLHRHYAFVYSNNIGEPFISLYDYVVVDPDNIDQILLKRYPKKLVAYISVGEIEPWRNYAGKVRKEWVLGENKVWGTWIADISNQVYQEFLFNRIEKLHREGFRNFFLDTLDSYQGLNLPPQEKEKQRKGLIIFIKELHRRYPKAWIITNRGFEVLDSIKDDINAVAAESLFGGYDKKKDAYVEVPPQERRWLLNQLRRAQSFVLDAIAIDYADFDLEKRRQIARKIAEEGIIPYVTDKNLQFEGESDFTPIKREILIIYNLQETPGYDVVFSDAHLIGALPLEYMGLVPIYLDVSSEDLPKHTVSRFSGIIVWLNSPLKKDENFFKWVLRQIKEGQKVLFINNFGFKPTQEHLAKLGIELETNHNSPFSPFTVEKLSPWVGFETEPQIEFGDIYRPKKAVPLIRIKYKNGQGSIPAAITPWGVYALDGSIYTLVGDDSYWVINPFAFFRKALRLPNFPIPDPTTLSGRRILISHVDGDAFVDKSELYGGALAGKVMLEEVFKRYRIPISVSVIEGEIGPDGLYPHLSKKAGETAREIFSLPWIEPASHTYSHPFVWRLVFPDNQEILKNKDMVKSILKSAVGESPPTYGLHLPIPGYKPELRREIDGSLSYVAKLSPKSKRKTKLLFWSGDCIIPRHVLKYVEERGILAINGGDTTITKDRPLLSLIAPFGVYKGRYLQVYVGEQNDNVYTEGLSRLWGYTRVIESFRLTDFPRRFKPVDIYYHFFSASRRVSLEALKKVYDWALKRPLTPIFTSEYIKIVKDFYTTGIARKGNKWIIKNHGHLQTLRIPKNLYPDLSKSQGVAGYITVPQGRYVCLDSRGQYLLYLSDKKKEKTPYLIEANARLLRVKERDGAVEFSFKSEVPFYGKFWLPDGWKISVSKGRVKRISSNIYVVTTQRYRGLIYVIAKH